MLTGDTSTIVAAVDRTIRCERRLVLLLVACVLALAGSLAWSASSEAATSCSPGVACLEVDDPNTDPIAPSNPNADPPVETYIHYAVTASNRGLVNLENVDLKTTPPVQTEDPRCRKSGSTVTCGLKTLRPGQSATVHFAVKTPDRTGSPQTVTKSFRMIWTTDQTGLTASESTTVRDLEEGETSSSWVTRNTKVTLSTDKTGNNQSNASNSQIANLLIPAQPNLAEAFLAQLTETGQQTPFAPCGVNPVTVSCGIGTWINNHADTPVFDPEFVLTTYHDSSLVAGLDTANARVAYSRDQPDPDDYCVVAESSDSDMKHCIQIMQSCSATSGKAPCATIEVLAGNPVTDPRAGDWKTTVIRSDHNGYMRMLGVCIPPTVPPIPPSGSAC